MAKRTKSQDCPSSEGSLGPKRTENSELRKLRNRISQKAFRARQAMRMKELEERLQNGTYSDAEWVTHLQDQNAGLREQLLECHKKFTSLQVSMKALADASAMALGIESLNGTDEVRHLDRKDDKDHNVTQPIKVAAETGGSPNFDLTAGDRLCVRCKAALSEPDGGSVNAAPSSSSIASPELGQSPLEELPNDNNKNNNGDDKGGGMVADMMDGIQPDSQPVPEINLDYFSPMDYPEQLEIFDDHQLLPVPDKYCPQPLSLDLAFTENLGPLKYRNILETSPTVVCHSMTVKKTNSPFSDHIDALDYCLSWSWSRWSTSAMPDDHPIGSILMTFVSLSWQSMTAWHTYTKAHVPLKSLMAWRICRTPDKYLSISPEYRPTKLQMSLPHPSIIDWIPWPQLRDKLIQHHSANPCLDSIICDIGNSYVVPADLSLLIKCPQPVLGYLAVWDLVRAIAPEATTPPSSTSSEQQQQQSRLTAAGHMQTFSQFQNPAGFPVNNANKDADAFEDLTLPAKDSKTLFSSRSLASQAFQLLGVNKGAFNWCLDPAFFGRHPELYDSSSDLMAQGVALRPNYQVPISAPRELDPSILGQYQEMSRYLIDVAWESLQISQPR